MARARASLQAALAFLIASPAALFITQKSRAGQNFLVDRQQAEMLESDTLCNYTNKGKEKPCL